MYTSGTTGPSKGVIVSQRQACGYAHGNFELMDLTPGDIDYAPLPLFHIAGQWAMCYASMIAGSAAVVTERFSVERVRDDARRFGAMANFLARQPDKSDDSDVPVERALRVPMFPDAGGFAKRFNMKIKTTFGSTEVSAPLRMDWDDPDWKTSSKHESLMRTTRKCQTALSASSSFAASSPGFSCRAAGSTRNGRRGLASTSGSTPAMP